MDLDSERTMEEHPMFADDGILPTQLPAGLTFRPEREGEMHLRYAVLEDALDPLKRNAPRNNRRQKRLFQANVEWFLVENWDWPFSLVNICRVLNS